MTRGNQRDIDRERARKRAEKAGVAKKTGDGNDGQLLKNKQEEQAELMRQKQKAADDKRAQEAALIAAASAKK